MGSIGSWWRRLSGRGKAVTLAAIAVVIVAIGSLGGQPDEQSPGVPGTSVAPVPQAAEGTPSGPPAVTTEPSVSPTATPAPTVAFADITLSGTGDAVPRFDVPLGSPAIAQITHSGTGNFAVVTLAEDGANNDLLVNTIGEYAGTVLFDEASQHSVAFEITAGGDWTISIRPVPSARAWDGQSPLTGTGDDVVRIDPIVTGLLSADVTHGGSGNFAILGYGGGPTGTDLIVNEIGTYSGEVVIGDGTFVLEVVANGAWTVTPS